MTETILATLQIMGWLGIVLEILVAINILGSTITNVWANHEKFSWKKLFQGIGRSLVFYFGAVCLSVTFSMFPFINNMIKDAFAIELFSEELLTTISGLGVLGVVVSTVVYQAQKALEGITKIATMTLDTDKKDKDL